MHITVTGAGGFIGSRLVQQLLQQPTTTKIVACDLSLATLPNDSRITRIEADTADPQVIKRIITPETNSVFHLAAIVSVGAEEDFDLGMRVNLDATRLLLEACRHTARAPRFVFASSVAAYGGGLPPVVEDTTPPAPQTSYGTQKVACELLISDYSRRGFIDGRSLRLPTIVVRPGKPNKAASTFASSIIREPLQGREVTCPVPPETSMFLLSPRKVVEAFLRARDLPADQIGWPRVIQLPGLTLSVRQMLDALKKVAGEKVANRVRFEPEERIMKIVATWPTAFRPTKAPRLGFTADENMEEIIRAFIADELSGSFVP